MFEGYKTYLAAIAALLIAVGAAIQQYCAGDDIELNLVVEAIIAIAMIFLRQGIKKDTTKIAEEVSKVVNYGPK